MDIKTCQDCNLSKDIKYFTSRHNSCNDCRNKKRRDSRLKNDFYRLKNIELASTNQKQCKYCNNIYKMDYFRKNRLKCKNCEKTYGRNYRKSDIGKAKQIDWHNSNLDRHKELQAIWYQNNKDKINKNTQNKLKNNPIQKLIKNYRRRLNLIIKKEASTLLYINCSQEFLLKYINYYLHNNNILNIDNYGKEWHIDHVIPISKLDLSNNDNLWCLEWYNLCPLKSEDNLKKNNSIDKIQIKEHLSKVKEFIKLYNIKDVKLNNIATYLN